MPVELPALWYTVSGSNAAFRTAVNSGAEYAEEKAEVMGQISRNQRIIMVVALVATVLSGILHYSQIGGVVLAFVVAGVGLAMLAAVVGEATDQLGERLSPGATGVLQSAIGNLP